MDRKNSNISKIFSWVFTVVMIMIIIKSFQIYKKYNFGDFIKAETQADISNFFRDDEIKYAKKASYKIESSDYNDAVFYKEVKVKPNTPYRVTCMVKTKNVEQQTENTDAGAMICLVETSQVSKNIIGTNDWQQLTFLFNSEKNETVKIGFRLGGNLGNCKGEAWFSDLKLEEGLANNNSNWKMACFIFKNMNIKNEKINISMDLDDVQTVKLNMKRFAESCEELSEYKMRVDYDIYEIEEPITTLSYSEEFKYHISPQDVKDIISDTVIKNEYDHIIVVTRMGDSKQGIQVNVGDWIGLGGMELYDIGFSTIRLSSNEESYTYEYNPGINTFPEETYLHEFLHTLEKNCIDYGYERPELHDYEIYGYKEESTEGLKQWYTDYMNKKIWDSKNSKNVGLNPIVYELKPTKNSNFEYPIEIELVKEPENIIEEIREIFKVIKTNI